MSNKVHDSGYESNPGQADYREKSDETYGRQGYPHPEDSEGDQMDVLEVSMLLLKGRISTPEPAVAVNLDGVEKFEGHASNPKTKRAHSAQDTKARESPRPWVSDQVQTRLNPHIDVWQANSQRPSAHSPTLYVSAESIISALEKLPEEQKPDATFFHHCIL